MSAPWWETYDDRSPIVYPRRDDAPIMRVGKIVSYIKGKGFVSTPIHVFTRRSWVKP